jgi:hypothetical protein
MTSKAFALFLKHRRIDDAIRAESTRRWPDPARLQTLKKMKLAVKDRLHALAMGRRGPRTV